MYEFNTIHVDYETELEVSRCCGETCNKTKAIAEARDLQQQVKDLTAQKAILVLTVHFMGGALKHTSIANIDNNEEMTEALISGGNFHYLKDDILLKYIDIFRNIWK